MQMFWVTGRKLHHRVVFNKEEIRQERIPIGRYRPRGNNWHLFWCVVCEDAVALLVGRLPGEVVSGGESMQEAQRIITRATEALRGTEVRATKHVRSHSVFRQGRAVVLLPEGCETP